MKSKSCLFALIAAFSTVILSAQSSSPGEAYYRLGAMGGASFPIGPTSSPLYAAGYYAELSADFPFASLPSLALSLGAGYRGIPLAAKLSARPRLDVAGSELGLGYSLPLSSALSLRGFARGGGYYGTLSNSQDFSDPGATTSWGLSLSAGLSIAFTGIPRLGLELGCRYGALLGLYDGLDAYLSSTIALRPRKKATGGGPIQPLSSGALSIESPRIGNVYPVFYKYYNDHPLGAVRLSNEGAVPVTDVTLSFNLKQYMDSPKICATIPRIEPGQGVDADILALFTDRMLEITEGTMVAADIVVEYSQDGQPVRTSRNEAIRVLDRNAMSWFDDRCAAAYVTAKDPAILTFAKNATSSIKASLVPEIDKSLQYGLVLHQALDLAGLGYVVDPKSSYSALSTSREVVDFLQFPRQTLEYRAGDCDDLSILFAALLESVGIETAFVTVPGHIFVALALESTAEEAQRSYTRPEELILREGRAWLPVEVTDRRGGFLSAWQTGAKEWRECSARDTAGFFPVHEAWAVFEPVGLPGASPQISSPPGEALLASFRAELSRFIDGEVAGRAAGLQAEVTRSQGAPKARNALGVLYAKYGKYDRAEAEFQQAVSRAEYAPALLNLGNILYLRKELAAAKAYYERAYAAEPDNAVAILSLARVKHDGEDYEGVKALYAALEARSPELARRFSYLGAGAADSTRAADAASEKGGTIWAE